MMKSIKILQLGSPTGLYGAERWILALVKHLDSAKKQNILLTGIARMYRISSNS